MRRKLGQLGSDLIERQSNALRKDDERNPPQDRSRISALASACPLGCDQSALFIKPKRGGGDTATARDVTNEKQVVHESNLSHWALDFKFT